MNRIPCEPEIRKLRKRFPAGCRIELLAIADPYLGPNPGEQGTVQGVDDLGQIKVQWDSGIAISIVPEEDKFVRVTKKD